MMSADKNHIIHIKDLYIIIWIYCKENVYKCWKY